MTCREFAEFLDAYVAGELPPEEVAEFERHLVVCAHCVAYLDGYRKTIDLCRGLGEAQDPVPVDVPEELVRAILRARKQG